MIDEPSYKGIRLSKADGEGVAWFNDIDFADGVIEFDVRGEDIKQHSFVGIALHGKSDELFDAIYLRPFQFRADQQILRNRAIQYISLPEFPWRKLREKFPGKYEASIEPAPDPNAWVHIRIEIKAGNVAAYINGNKTPSLVIQKLNATVKGRIGFYVADTSGGDFANIAITPAN